MATQEKLFGSTAFTSFPDRVEAIDACVRAFGCPEDASRVSDMQTTLRWTTDAGTPLMVLEVQKLGARWLVIEPLVGGFRTLVLPNG